MPDYVIERLDALLGKKGLSLKQAKVLVVGVTYKKDVLDLRKSPALDIIEGLKREKAQVCYHDPVIPYLKLSFLDMRSRRLNQQALGQFDCVLIATDHSQIDYEFIRRNARLIFDTRNVYRGVKDEKIHRL
jgi:UDP-N-acetyl-D-glucosamine dehydrogenase